MCITVVTWSSITIQLYNGSVCSYMKRNKKKHDSWNDSQYTLFGWHAWQFSVVEWPSFWNEELQIVGWTAYMANLGVPE